MSKVIPLAEAVRQNVRDGDLVYAAGFTHLIPFAAGHEIIRQRIRDLVLARATPDLVYDQMVAAGCARKVIFSYMGNPGVGSLRIVRSELEAGRLEWEEYSHFGMISRLQAGATGLPFMPMNPTAAGDLEKANPNYRTRDRTPIRGEKWWWSQRLIRMWPLSMCSAPMQTATHRSGVSSANKRKLPLLHKRVILTTEEIVDESIIRSDPNRTLIPGFIVDAVCHVPYCAHPSYTQGYYDRDNSFYLKWDEISSNRDATQAYLDEWVYGVKDRAEYWEKLGTETHQRLKIESRPSATVDYGKY